MPSGELVTMYKFHLINTNRMSSKTRCDRVLRFRRKYIFLGQDFSFYYMFKTNFSGHKKILGHKKLGSTTPDCPLATGLPVKQTFRTWIKILLH